MRVPASLIRRAAFWVPALICFAVAATPNPGGDSNPTLSLVLHTLSGYLVHLLAFTYLALTLCIAHFRRGDWLAVLAWLTAYGVLIEIMQFFAPGRDAQLNDIAVNALGIVLGLFAYHQWRRRVTNSNPPAATPPDS